MKKVFKIVGILLGVIVLLLIGGVVFLMLRFPLIEEAPIVKIDATTELIERGEYLVNNVTACFECHSPNNETYFSKPIIKGKEGSGRLFLGDESGFPGNLYSRNITPTTLKNWTDGEIMRAVTSGIGKDGNPLFAIMPYKSYQQLSEPDLHAIIAYLRSIPALEGETTATTLNFPLNLVVRIMPKPAQAKPHPDFTNALERGKYLTFIAGCHSCHTNGEDAAPFSGGTEYPLNNGMLRSANITPDNETGLGSWTLEDFIQKFRMFAEPEMQTTVVADDSYNTEMPWTVYAGMTEEDLTAIYTYLRSVKPVKNSIDVFTPTPK
ncbi:MAG: cytochrome C [Calditrichaeota bacterium]|nr:MAG: cytochrome C [Calditrichota bacterium]